MHYREVFSAVYRENDPGSLDLALQQLRRCGADYVQSVALLMSMLGITISNARSLLAYSEAWGGAGANSVLFCEKAAALIGRQQ